MFETLIDVSKIAPLVTTLILAVSVTIAFIQLRNARRVENERHAHAIWTEYMNQCLKYPKFAYPRNHISKILEDSDELNHYEWFVGYMLDCMAEIVFNTRARKYWWKWEPTVLLQLSHHSEYFETTFKKKEFSSSHPKEIVELIDKVLEKNKH